jgi:hypothetical protein
MLAAALDALAELWRSALDDEGLAEVVGGATAPLFEFVVHCLGAFPPNKIVCFDMGKAFFAVYLI